MGQIKVSFFGLCYFRLVDDESRECSVYLLSGQQGDESHGSHAHGDLATKGPAHVATLSVLVDDIDPEQNQWPPDAIVYVGGRPVACFFLHDAMMVSLDTGPNTGDPIQWNNRTTSIDFATLHNYLPTKPPHALKHELNASLSLQSGTLTSGNPVKNLVVKPGLSEEVEQATVARSVDWVPTGNVLTVSCGKRYFVTNKPGENIDRVLHVVNVSTELPSKNNPYAHFDIYYSLFERTVAFPFRMRLAKSKGKGMTRALGTNKAMGEGVYDCVPPGTGS